MQTITPMAMWNGPGAHEPKQQLGPALAVGKEDLLQLQNDRARDSALESAIPPYERPPSHQAGPTVRIDLISAWWAPPPHSLPLHSKDERLCSLFPSFNLLISNQPGLPTRSLPLLLPLDALHFLVQAFSWESLHLGLHCRWDRVLTFQILCQLLSHSFGLFWLLFPSVPHDLMRIWVKGFLLILWKGPALVEVWAFVCIACSGTPCPLNMTCYSKIPRI